MTELFRDFIERFLKTNAVTAIPKKIRKLTSKKAKGENNESASLGDGVLFFEARFQFLEINGNTRVGVSRRGTEILHGP